MARRDRTRGRPHPEIHRSVESDGFRHHRLSLRSSANDRTREGNFAPSRFCERVSERGSVLDSAENSPPLTGVQGALPRPPVADFPLRLRLSSTEPKQQAVRSCSKSRGSAWKRAPFHLHLAHPP